MKRKIELGKMNSEQELDSKVLEVSKNNPDTIVVVSCIFQRATVHVMDRQPRTDCPATTQTFKHYGGFFKNGKVVKPTKTWMKRYNFIPVSR